MAGPRVARIRDTRPLAEGAREPAILVLGVSGFDQGSHESGEASGDDAAGGSGLICVHPDRSMTDLAVGGGWIYAVEPYAVVRFTPGSEPEPVLERGLAYDRARSR